MTALCIQLPYVYTCTQTNLPSSTPAFHPNILHPFNEIQGAHNTTLTQSAINFAHQITSWRIITTSWCCSWSNRPIFPHPRFSWGKSRCKKTKHVAWELRLIFLVGCKLRVILDKLCGWFVERKIKGELEDYFFWISDCKETFLWQEFLNVDKLQKIFNFNSWKPISVTRGGHWIMDAGFLLVTCSTHTIHVW